MGRRQLDLFDLPRAAAMGIRARAPRAESPALRWKRVVSGLEEAQGTFRAPEVAYAALLRIERGEPKQWALVLARFNDPAYPKRFLGMYRTARAAKAGAQSLLDTGQLSRRL